MVCIPQNEKKNFLWIDALRTAAIFGVVVIHVAADVITEWGAVPRSWWNAANLYDSLVRGCVPVFIMVSGALLLPGKEGYKDFFRKRFNRIAIPFIAWTVLYLVWKKLFYQPNLGWNKALKLAAGDGVYFHLWFLYVLAGLYLVTPLFRILVAYASKRDILYFLGLWFVVASLLPFAETLSRLFAHTDWHFSIPIEPAQGFIGYFVLGYFLNQYAAEKKLPLGYASWTAGLVVCAAGTYLLTRHFHSFQMALYDNMAPNVFFYAASFFVIIKFSGPFLEQALSPKMKSIVLQLSKASFGIYLIHPMFLDTLIKGRLGFTLTGKTFHPLWMIPLTAIIVFTLSFYAVRLILKIPYLRRIV